MVERVILVHGDRGHEVDGIRDYSERLAEELSRRSVDVELRLSWRGAFSAADADAVVLQYSPFNFGRWGFAPRLPAELLALRSRARRPVLAVMVHEPYVPMDSGRGALMGMWQRLQLTALRLGADAVFASIDTWAARFARQRPRRPTHHLPVASNLPDMRSRREAARARLEIEEGTLVLSALGSGHPSWLGDYVAEAANAVAASGSAVRLLCMGAGAPAPPGLDAAVEVYRPGRVEAAELAEGLAASDLFLAPLIDGVSTRRGSMMAALQHGLPVVGTDGPLTDSILRGPGSGMSLTRVGDKRAFAAAVLALAEDVGARASSAAAARELYERNFDWPVAADRLLSALPDR
jgi:glycosyltransferase involved in cell wall biosynthesis